MITDSVIYDDNQEASISIQDQPRVSEKAINDKNENRAQGAKTAFANSRTRNPNFMTSNNKNSNLWNAINERKLYQSVEDPSYEYHDNPF